MIGRGKKQGERIVHTNWSVINTDGEMGMCDHDLQIHRYGSWLLLSTSRWLNLGWSGPMSSFAGNFLTLLQHAVVLVLLVPAATTMRTGSVGSSPAGLAYPSRAWRTPLLGGGRRLGARRIQCSPFRGGTRTGATVATHQIVV